MSSASYERCVMLNGWVDGCQLMDDGWMDDGEVDGLMGDVSGWMVR